MPMDTRRIMTLVVTKNNIERVAPRIHAGVKTTIYFVYDGVRTEWKVTLPLASYGEAWINIRYQFLRWLMCMDGAVRKGCVKKKTISYFIRNEIEKEKSHTRLFHKVNHLFKGGNF